MNGDKCKIKFYFFPFNYKAEIIFVYINPIVIIRIKPAFPVNQDGINLEFIRV